MTESEDDDDKGPFDRADRTCVLRPSVNLIRDGLQPKHCTVHTHTHTHTLAERLYELSAFGHYFKIR